MPRGVRTVLIISLAAVLALSLAVGLTYASVHRAGVIAVSVQPGDGGDINVAVPAGVASLALSCAAWAPLGALVIDEHAEPWIEQMEPYWPAAQQALDELARMPDFTLVEVSNDEEYVLVRKEGRRLSVLVESDEGRVSVSIPLRTVREFARKLERLLDEY